jgi:hypothetical protein
MRATWLKKTAALAFIVALVPTAASSQDRDSGSALPGLSAGIAVEAARLASGEARQPGKLENTSQGSSSPSRNRSGSQAACGVAFGFIGMLVGSMIAEKFPGPDPMSTQLAGVAIGGGSGVAIGIWLGGR